MDKRELIKDENREEKKNMTMMKKRHILHWAMGVIMTPLLGSCTSDDVVGGAGREECDIISGQPITVTSATRATYGSTSSTPFYFGEIVWMWALKLKDGTTTEYINAWQLTPQNDGSFDGNAKYWPSDGSLLTFYALHGNFGNTTIKENSTPWADLSLTHTVETDQRTEAKKLKSDLLYAKTDPVSSKTTPTKLTFEHLLAKITVKLDLTKSQGITAEDLSSATVKLTNILTTGIFKSSDVSNIITDGVKANTSGSRGEIKAGIITQPSDMNSTAYEVGSAIVPLQDFGGGKSTSSDDNVITITLSDGRSFSYKPTNPVGLTAGNEYIYTLKIINGVLSVSSITVTKFTDNSVLKSWDIYLGELSVSDITVNGLEPTTVDKSWDIYVESSE